MSSPAREMNLSEYVSRLPDHHMARREHDALLEERAKLREANARREQTCHNGHTTKTALWCCPVCTEDHSEEIVTLMYQNQRMGEDLESFNEEWVCPECQSYDTREHKHEDDFSSRHCSDCQYTGSPGEDFPTVRKVKQDLAQLRSEKEELEYFRTVTLSELDENSRGAVTGHMWSAVRERLLTLDACALESGEAPE